ncbi:E3 ubiquitin ligase BIG BROTHER-related-like isoform X1 [Actinidia eriantha]|uniref:E3 ubiquitin ligase BIG BROTHER-related-like isoform X1 n=1 Tax=Actinidia eriantha TaxID=165200 RepID=UPI002585B176|nr:E3 ubiquitin ligase BIG BROTHER-related-like isoform X1 [Actinidia eriantha]XP_057481405.1 E3 ubiquitin ligase BIG BROTHER-related-like isoform X1 [Actinidia eriantha]XP_057481413.1 E3 ubiquitin ligase BIG BROTHER-related-like isoform X1 [Actinidia eriantha]
MMRNGEHSLNGTIPAEIAENLKEIFPEFGDLNYEEVLQHQESVYQSLKGNNDSNKERRSSSGQSSDSSQFSGQEREPSRQESFDSQLALDEAVARSLQELEDNFDDLNISQSSSNATENTEFSSRETPSTSINQTPRGDDVDPDNMTYEQLQLLEESVGSVNKGLSEQLISRLPYFKYKTGILSKKKEKQECVICCMKFKHGDKLISLPCAHQYHSKCITHWLQLKNNCPVCQNEVSED